MSQLDGRAVIGGRVRAIHWWSVGVAPCGVMDVWQEFTGEPDQVTCPVCRDYVVCKCIEVGTTPELLGADVRRVLEAK